MSALCPCRWFKRTLSSKPPAFTFIRGDIPSVEIVGVSQVTIQVVQTPILPRRCHVSGLGNSAGLGRPLRRRLRKPSFRGEEEQIGFSDHFIQHADIYALGFQPPLILVCSLPKQRPKTGQPFVLFWKAKVWVSFDHVFLHLISYNPAAENLGLVQSLHVLRVKPLFASHVVDSHLNSQTYIVVAHKLPPLLEVLLRVFTYLKRFQQLHVFSHLEHSPFSSHLQDSSPVDLLSEASSWLGCCSRCSWPCCRCCMHSMGILWRIGPCH